MSFIPYDGYSMSWRIIFAALLDEDRFPRGAMWASECNQFLRWKEALLETNTALKWWVLRHDLASEDKVWHKWLWLMSPKLHALGWIQVPSYVYCWRSDLWKLHGELFKFSWIKEQNFWWIIPDYEWHDSMPTIDIFSSDTEVCPLTSMLMHVCV